MVGWVDRVLAYLNTEATIKEDAVTWVDPQAYNASSLCKTPSV